MLKRLVLLAVMALTLMGASECEGQRASKGAKREQAATHQLQDQASTAVGMPAMVNFTEKRMMKMLYERRDDAGLVTYTYYLDLYGKRHKICPSTSVGYGIPYSAQFTAPQASQATQYGSAGTWAPYQPEPNGLYMPDSSSATWVMCLVEDEIAPVYIEPLLIVSPFELTSVD